MSENIKYLGWGIMGASRGRQQVNEGINKTLRLDFELEQSIGECLPNPNQDFTAVLYYLTHKEVNGSRVVALAEYRPIFEKGQTRSGPYFGAFIESVNSSFHPNSATQLTECLFELSQYQYQNFIDEKTKTYKESIADKTFESPLALLNGIADNLQALNNDLEGVEKQGTLYIHCAEGQATEALKQLLQTQLFHRYKQIYLSENEHIFTKIRQKKVEIMGYAQLVAYADFVAPYRQLLVQARSQETDTLKRLEQLKNQQKQIIKQSVQQHAASYIQQAEQAKAQAEQAELQLHQAKALSAFGATVLQEVGKQAAPLGHLELAQFAPKQSDLEGRLSQIDNSIKSLMLKISNQQTAAPQYENEEESSSGYIKFALVISTFLAIAFFAWAIIATFFTGISESDLNNRIKKAEEPLKEQLQQAKEESEKKAQDYQNQLEELRKQKTKICDKIRTLSSKHPNDSKEAKQLCENQ